MIVKTKVLIFSFLGCAIITGVVISIVYGFVLNKKEALKLRPGAIVSNGFECAAIGAKIHEKGNMVTLSSALEKVLIII